MNSIEERVFKEHSGSGHWRKNLRIQPHEYNELEWYTCISCNGKGCARCNWRGRYTVPKTLYSIQYKDGKLVGKRPPIKKEDYARFYKDKFPEIFIDE